MTIHIAEGERVAEPAEVRQLSAFRSLLAELHVIWMRLEHDAPTFVGAHDVLRSAIAILDRQYLDMEKEIG